MPIGMATQIRDKELRGSFRCVECGERVRAHRKGTTGQAAHFEHLQANPKCTLSKR